jgi:hypothetical protein
MISTLAHTGVTFMGKYLQNTEAQRYKHKHILRKRICNACKYEQKKHTDTEGSILKLCCCRLLYNIYLYAVNSDCGKLSSDISFWQQSEFHICTRERTVEEQSSSNPRLSLYSLSPMMKVLPNHCTTAHHYGR